MTSRIDGFFQRHEWAAFFVLCALIFAYGVVEGVL